MQNIIFTFHYVSIKSFPPLPNINLNVTFTFHYVSIKSSRSFSKPSRLINLHSTMYLLNRAALMIKVLLIVFTFHYVSIKSGTCHIMIIVLKIFTFHYVSIKSILFFKKSQKAFLFTFHYVSIKSGTCTHSPNSLFHLHSTMYLLNPGIYHPIHYDTIIYIPLCIY